MNGCDRLDQAVSFYNNLDRKTTKWWKRLFNWILEVTQVNAYILFILTRKQGCKPIPFRDFKEKLIEDLVDLAILLTPENEKKRKAQKVDSALERHIL